MSQAVENSVRVFRDRSGLSQQALAERTGVTRQAIIAIEAGRQVPGTTLALGLARALGVRVDELFRLADPDTVDAFVAPTPSGADDAGSPRVAVGRVGNRWVAHRLPLDDAMSADGVVEPGPDVGSPSGRVRMLVDPGSLRERVLVAGCAPLLALASHRLSARFPTTRMRWLPATSGRALDLLEAGTIHVAGIHLSGGDAASVNRDAVQRRFQGRDMLIVNLTVWRQGLIVPEGNPDGIRDATDLLRPGLRFVGRESGAGASQLVARLLAQAGAQSGPRTVGVASGHEEVARYVRYGGADAGVAIEGVAAAPGLGFVPLTQERFDLVLPSELAGTEPVRRLLDVLDDPGFRDEIGRFPGYDGSLAGHVEAIGS